LRRYLLKKIFYFNVIFLTTIILSHSALSNENKKPKFVFSLKEVTSKSDTIKNPKAVYYDKKKEIYVLDSGNKRVIIFSEDTFPLFSFKVAQTQPKSLTVDEEGNIYVLYRDADKKEDYVKIYNFRGEKIKFFSLKKLINFPEDKQMVVGKIIYFDGKLYFSDLSHCKIHSVDMISKKVLLSFGDCGKDEGKFKHLTDFALNKEGKIYVIDMTVSKISVFSKDGEFLYRFGDPGGTFRTLSLPVAISVDEYENTYVVDSMRHTVLVYDKNGNFSYEFGGYGKSQGWFYYPRGIFVSSGRIFVLEDFISRVQVFEVP
jgi:DNA-binding beta-propeller fold protein YncE